MTPRDIGICRHNHPTNAQTTDKDTNMSTPKRIQRKRTKGWRMPEDTVYVGRPTDWGNPYKAGPNVDRMPWLPEGTVLTVQQTVDCYRDMCVGHGPNLVADELLALSRRDGLAVMLLKGKDLACWCPLDQPCHADVLLELANA